MSNVKPLIYMKTYFILMMLCFGIASYSFAAQDTSLPMVTLVNQHTNTVTLNYLETISQQDYKLSWKEKTALKLVKKKIAKAEKKIKKGKKANFFGGLIALLVIGIILIPIGIFILFPLLIIGAILLALGIVGSVLGGLGSIF